MGRTIPLPPGPGPAGPRAARVRPRWALVLVGLLSLAGIGVLTALGVWQLERRVWKLDLIERVEQRIHAAPVPAPGPETWASVTAATDEYRRVRVTGRFLDDRETLVQAVTGLGGGYWVLTPFQTTGGFTVLVNRGFVPPERRAPGSRAAGRIDGETTVTGLLRLSEPKGGFLRGNDPAGDRWHSRDVQAIAAARGLTGVAPYFIDAEATRLPEGAPVGGLTVVSFPNNHLVYALTWFALALMLAGGLTHVLRSEYRRRRPQ
ncbi:SURF1 family protein [Azospirillum thermophilum]|uniref:SURF1-like protein n=1 Tax=Azospirillum thermophilum TaxID=2202148 RepID=A0A2S2CXU3_9PROT|nr:SURF1 family protein [Azospirillum thermophilum]AWK89333.1 Surfeit locus 1 family protein [Azospirillum thermophilum]